MKHSINKKTRLNRHKISGFEKTNIFMGLYVVARLDHLFEKQIKQIMPTIMKQHRENLYMQFSRLRLNL